MVGCREGTLVGFEFCVERCESVLLPRGSSTKMPVGGCASGWASVLPVLGSPEAEGCGGPSAALGSGKKNGRPKGLSVPLRVGGGLTGAGTSTVEER